MTSTRKKPITTQEEDDSYWNESSNFKRFDFNDDVESDSIEVVNWDGKAVNTNPSLSRSVSNATPQRSSMVSSARNHGSARAYHSARSAPRSGNNDVPAPTSRLSRQSTLPNTTPVQPKSHQSKGLTLQTTAPTLAEDANLNQVSATQLVTVMAENRDLNRKLQEERKKAEQAPSIEKTLQHFMVGDPYVLELYKSKENKCLILDKAIERCDGNAILAATLFMRNTLKRELFSKELMKREEAINAYCMYLKASNEIDELHETLSALGRTEEAAIIKYKSTLSNTSNSSPQIRIDQLEDCIRFYFDPDPQLSVEKMLIKEQINLIKVQEVIESVDKKAEETGTNEIFKTHPRSGSIVNKAVVPTLFYSCCYHWGEPDNIFSSPKSLVKAHNINRKQFEFVAAEALCWRRSWLALRKFFTQEKTFIRAERLNAEIGLDKLVEVLHQNHAPADILELYSAGITNAELRLYVAQTFNCYKVAADTLSYLRDRQGLQNYINTIPPTNAMMRKYADDLLKNRNTKWKN